LRRKKLKRIGRYWTSEREELAIGLKFLNRENQKKANEWRIEGSSAIL